MFNYAKYAKLLTFLAFEAKIHKILRGTEDCRGSVIKHETLEFVFKSKAKSKIGNNERFLHSWFWSHHQIFPKIYQTIVAVKRL